MVAIETAVNEKFLTLRLYLAFVRGKVSSQSKYVTSNLIIRQVCFESGSLYNGQSHELKLNVQLPPSAEDNKLTKVEK